MPDAFGPEVRSKIMKAIKGKDTKPELALKAALGVLGFPHREPGMKLPGRPDVVLPDRRLAVFVHGCFWHCCRLHYKAPKSRVEHWRDHMAKNVRRDRRVRRQLRSLGWRTMVVWEHEDMGKAARRVANQAAKAAA